MTDDKELAELVKNRTTETKLDLANVGLTRFPSGFWVASFISN